MIRRFVFSLALCCLSGSAVADEIRPGYLELKEGSPDVFSVLWKVPARGNKKLSLKAGLPPDCRNKTRPNTQLINGGYIERWIVACDGGLVQKTISIEGLESTNTDVLLRMEFLDDTSQSVRLSPARRTFQVPAKASSVQIIGTYTWLGIEHILLGVDHLLFIFALLLIVKSLRRLLWTITAFTLAHSLTLAGATLGLVHVQQQPVEAVIALSIMFLAMEYVHGRHNRRGAAERWPWLVAFVFGLLHGFGFAGALAEVGLPQHAIPIALVFFNIGVELGQLMFVSAVVLLGLGLKRLTNPVLMRRAEMAVIYTIGGVSSFWLLERVNAF